MQRMTILDVRDGFYALAERFGKYESKCCPAHYLAEDLYGAMVQAGRLMVHAIDLGAFPKELSEQNGGWWDRSSGRLPGNAITVYGGIPLELLTGVQIRNVRLRPTISEEAKEEALKRYNEAAMCIEKDWQYGNCWTYTICWLQRKFSNDLRLDAFSLFFTHIQKDQFGRPVALDQSEMTLSRPSDPAKTPPFNEDSYEEIDWQVRHQRQAEACADACKLLARLVDEGAGAIHRSERTAEEALKASRLIGSSVLGLLGWGYLAHKAGQHLPAPVRTSMVGTMASRNIDAGDVAWRIITRFVGRATAITGSRLELVAMYMGCDCKAENASVYEDFHEIKRLLNLSDNAGLFDFIIDELETQCPEVAADVLHAVHRLRRRGVNGQSSPATEEEVTKSSHATEPRVEVKPMTTTAIADILRCSTRQVSKYAEKVGVQRPERGQRNFEYEGSSVVKIICYAATQGSSPRIVNGATEWLTATSLDNKMEKKSN